MSRVLQFFREALRILTGIYGALMAVLICLNVMDRYYVPVKFNPPVYLAAAALTIGLMYWLLQKHHKKFQSSFAGHQKWITIFLVMAVVYVLQMILVSYTWQSHGWDVKVVMARITGEISENAVDWYMRVHQNNVLICGFLTDAVPWLADLLKINPWHAASILSMSAVDVSILLHTAALSRFVKDRAVFTVFFFLVVFIAFQPQNLIPYTDTFGMLFVSILIFCISIFLSLRSLPVWLAVSAVFGYFLILGYHLKPTIIILGIAFLLALLISGRKIRMKKVLTVLLCLSADLAGTIGARATYGQAELTVLGYHPSAKERDRDEYVLQHYLAMGLFEDEETGCYGGFNPEDDQRISSTQWKAEKIEVSNQLIRERLSKMGFSGFLRHIWHKMAWVSTDGNFFYRAYGRNLDDQEDPSAIERFLSGWNNIKSPLYLLVTANWFEGLWLVIMLGIALSIRKKGWTQLLKRKHRISHQKELLNNSSVQTGKRDQADSDREKETFNSSGLSVFLNTERLAMAGIILFLILFEARARYIYLYAPCFTTLGVFGLYISFSKAACILSLKRKHLRNRKLNEGRNQMN